MYTFASVMAKEITLLTEKVSRISPGGKNYDKVRNVMYL